MKTLQQVYTELFNEMKLEVEHSKDYADGILEGITIAFQRISREITAHEEAQKTTDGQAEAPEERTAD